MTHRRLLVLLSIASIAVLLPLAILAEGHARFPGDHSVARGIQAIPGLEPLADFFDDEVHVFLIPALTVAGSALFLWRREWEYAIAVILLLPGSPLNTVFKWMVERPRPAAVDVDIRDFPSTSSFPSGHSFDAASFGVMLAFAAWYIGPPRPVVAAAIAAGAVIFLLGGLARVWLGAHWPSDVVAGWLFGSAYAMLLWAAASFFAERRTPSRGPAFP